MDKAWKKFKQQCEENPIGVILVLGITAASAAKLIDAVSAAQGRRAYARQVDLRARGL